MSSHQNLRKRLSWFNRLGNKIFCKRYKHSQNHFERDYFKMKSHMNLLTNSFDNRIFTIIETLSYVFAIINTSRYTRILNEQRASKYPHAWRLSLPRYNWHDTRNCLLSRSNCGTMKRDVRNAGTAEQYIPESRFSATLGVP